MQHAWDEEVDLAVIGFGAAGAATAITASRLGASVLLAEKQAEQAHTPNTRMSRGIVMAVNDVDKATEYLTVCAGGMVPEAPLRALAEKAADVIGWLAEACPDLPYSRVRGAEHPDFPGAEGIDAYQPGHARFMRDPRGLTGRDLYAHLKQAVQRTPTRLAWEAPARRLIREPQGPVLGVELETPAGVRMVRARHGVVLTCGGFEYDEQAKINYLRAYPMYFYGNPGNTGDGLRMAQEAGADLWHMNQIVGRAIGHFTLESGVSMGFQLGIDSTAMGFHQDPSGFIITDRFGKRFANENVQALLMHNFYFDLLQFDPQRGVYPRIPCYWFFDERRRTSGPLSSPFVGANAVGLYDWSHDNLREVESGWILSGGTIAEVAAKAGLDDPQAVERTITEYNAACARGQPDEFGRPPESLVPLDTPPFYCVTLWPGGSNTTGGPRRDEHARVVDALGQPIEGLFAAGELGQVSGLLYAADGANLCEALCFGQIAAATAVARRNSAA